MNPSKVEKVAGSGNKFIHMADNRSDYYLNLVPGFKNWDMVGSEAILAARFGVVTDAYKRPIKYCPESSFTLRNGIVAAKSKSIYEFCNNTIEQCSGIPLEMNHKKI